MLLNQLGPGKISLLMIFLLYKKSVHCLTFCYQLSVLFSKFCVMEESTNLILVTEKEMLHVGDATGSDRHNSSGESNQERTIHVEPIYEAFLCPLTKKVMQDPVTIDTGCTFERVEIEKWFKKCRDNGKKITCPFTSQEIKSTTLNPSFALKNTIEEWRKRNEASQLEFIHRSLSPGNSESDILRALKYVQDICQRGKSQKHIMLAEEVVPMVSVMLKNGSEDIRCQALKTLRIIAEEDKDCEVVKVIILFFLFCYK